MIDRNIILACLGIQDEKVWTFDSIIENGETHIYLNLKDERIKCPYCQNDKIVIKDYYNTTINNSIIRLSKVFVHIKMRRYLCKTCRKTFRQQFFLGKFGRSTSFAVEMSVMESLKKKVSFKDVAEEHNISVTQCIRIFDESNKFERLSLTRAICVDEFFFKYDKKGDAQYPFIIVDPNSAKIIDILPYRTKPYLESYFRCIPKEERAIVNFFVSDMNETYRAIKKKFFPQALHIVDHFHVIKIFNEKLKHQRLEIMKSCEKDSYEYKFLKKYHKMFYKNVAELKQMRKINERTGEIFDRELELKYVLRHYPQLQEIYFAREDFAYSMMKLEDRYKTFNKMDFYIQKFEKSTNKYVREIASTFKNWRFEIVNAYSKNDYHFCLTNAIAENMNGEVKKLINISYGYNNFERLRKRILYINAH